MDSFIGEIRIFGFPYAPMDWAVCDGSILPVNQCAALYSVIGNFFGGTPNVTFALPDLRARAALATSGSFGVGAVTGCDVVGLSVEQLGPHSHTMKGNGTAAASNETAGAAANTSYPGRLLTPPSGGAPLQIQHAYSTAGAGTPDRALANATLGPAGNGQPHDNHQPYLALNFCISLAGEYPLRP